MRQIVDWVESIQDKTFSILKATTAQFGTPPDYTEFEDDGTLVQYGNATTWEDIQTSLIGRRLASPSGIVAYDYTEAAIVWSGNGTVTNDNDCVIWAIQTPHKAKMDFFNVHMHWEQVNSVIHTWDLQYRIQSNGAAKTSAWTTVSRSTGGSYDAFTYTSGTLNQITRLAEIDVSGASISSVLQFRLTKSAGTGSIRTTFVDSHYEADALGSNEEYVK
jgi:hypothetical protein